jgi:hypothetical protein
MKTEEYQEYLECLRETIKDDLELLTEEVLR